VSDAIFEDELTLLDDLLFVLLLRLQRKVTVKLTQTQVEGLVF